MSFSFRLLVIRTLFYLRVCRTQDQRRVSIYVLPGSLHPDEDIDHFEILPLFSSKGTYNRVCLRAPSLNGALSGGTKGSRHRDFTAYYTCDIGQFFLNVLSNFASLDFG